MNYFCIYYKKLNPAVRENTLFFELVSIEKSLSEKLISDKPKPYLPVIRKFNGRSTPIPTTPVTSKELKSILDPRKPPKLSLITVPN